VSIYFGIAHAGAAVVSNDAAIKQIPKPIRRGELGAECDSECVLNIQISFLLSFVQQATLRKRLNHFAANISCRPFAGSFFTGLMGDFSFAPRFSLTEMY
jgi:hypothetical protein